jgi:predicted nuclease of restriction endonuclease-like (RecB) superfamily
VLGSITDGLPDRINSFINDVASQTKHIVSKLIVKRAIGIGFLINEEERVRGEKFNLFWKEVSCILESLGCNYSSKRVLFEAKVLYLAFKRFTTVIDGYLAIDNISIPFGVSKKHLLLIDRYCVDKTQQNIFILKVIENSLSTNELKAQLLSGVVSDPNVLLMVDNLAIRKNYNLNCLCIDNTWNENAIKKHLIKNISSFIDIVFGPYWSFLPNAKSIIGECKKYPDMVFYNVKEHRFLIIDLKCTCLASSVDRAKSQMTSYVEARDKRLDLRFQKKTIGLILGKEPINELYFNSTGVRDNIFYCAFTI